MEKNAYKLYQMLDFFVSKHSYKTLFIKEVFKENELWFVNKDKKSHPVIRVTLSTLEENIYELDRIRQCLDVIEKNLHIKNIELVDIHISNEIVDENDKDFISICMETNYYSGSDISDSFPGIKHVLHDVDNCEQEIYNIITKINNDNKEMRKNKLKRFLNINSLGTYIVMGICIIVYIVSWLISMKYSESASLIITGADYKMFTLGLKEYWRLLTTGFNHSSIIHILMNMLSLFYLGTYIESKYGHVKFLLALFLGVIVGSLTQGILTGTSNTFTVGISGGLYSLIVIYTIDVVKSGFYNKASLISVILVNLALNFMSGVAWQAHLGGAITGLLFYMIYNSSSKFAYILLLVIAIGALTYKYINIKQIDPKYGGTDSEIIQFYRDHGMNNLANKITYKLNVAYDKY